MKNRGLMKDVVAKSRLYCGLLKAQHNKKQVPLVINLYITGKCNSKCAYCYVEIDKEPEREFSFHKWKVLIDDLYDRGTRMISLVGGEPLLHPDIDALVEYIVSKNIFLNLTTNGFLLSKHLDAAKKANEVSISLDGDRDSHNKNRGKSSFERVVKGIDLAVKNNIRVRLCSVITRHNFDQINFLIDFARKRNLFIYVSSLIDPPDIRKDAVNDLRLTDQQMKEFFVQLKEAKKKPNTPIINSFASIDYLLNYPLPFSDIINKDSPHAEYYQLPCPYGRFQYLINNLGDIYPCGIMWNNDSYHAKNIFDVGLDDALANASRNLKCQCCSFANAIDWNSITSFPWLWYGLKMTLKQALGKVK